MFTVHSRISCLPLASSVDVLKPANESVHCSTLIDVLSMVCIRDCVTRCLSSSSVVVLSHGTAQGTGGHTPGVLQDAEKTLLVWLHDTHQPCE